MSKSPVSVLVHNDSPDRQAESHIKANLTQRRILFHESRTPDELLKLVRAGHYHTLILVIGDSVSYSLEQVMTKARNLSHCRDLEIISIHSTYNDPQIQRALMLGATEIYVEPFDADTLLTEEEPKPAPFFELGPIPCTVDVFGRLGKIFKEPLGNLHIETNVHLQPGDRVTLTSMIGRDLKMPRLEYDVLEDRSWDRYYRYARAYVMKWNSNVELREQMLHWTLKHKADFALPKTKVLWLIENLDWNREAKLPKDVFSVYTADPNSVTKDVLDFINPRIVVTERDAGPEHQVLWEWMSEHPQQNKILKKWDENEFVATLKGLLRERVSKSIESAHYLNRKSVYSRLSVMLEGEIIETSGFRVRIRTKFPVAAGTVVRVHSKFFNDLDTNALYFKILSVRETGGRHVHESQIIPITDTPNRTLTELKLLFDQSQAGSQPKQRMAHAADAYRGLEFAKGKSILEEAFSELKNLFKKS